MTLKTPSKKKSLGLLEVSSVPVSLEKDLTVKRERVMVLVYAAIY